MGQILIRGLPTEVLDQLKQRAQANSRSLEAEARLILKDAATQARDFEEGMTKLEQLRRELAGRRFSKDSVELIREDRDR